MNAIYPEVEAFYLDLHRNPELSLHEQQTLASALRETRGQANVVEIPPKMVFEDFSEFSLAGVPSVLFAVGGVEPAKFAAAQQSGAPLPELHSSLWGLSVSRR